MSGGRYADPDEGSQQEWGDYDPLGKDPRSLRAVIERLEGELQREQRARHDVERQLERARHANAHLELNLRELEGKFAMLSPRGKQRAKERRRYQHTPARTFDEDGEYYNAAGMRSNGDDDSEAYVGYDDTSNDEDFSDSTASQVQRAAGYAQDTRVRRIQNRARHLFNALKTCQAERDDLKKQSSGDARVKEFLDAQLSRLEDQVRRLHHQNGDLRTQCAADAKMKEYLAQEWESVRGDMESLRGELVSVTKQRDDMLVQTRADQRVKEYLSTELERYEKGEAGVRPRRGGHRNQSGGRYD